MITRPAGLSFCEVELLFNLRTYKILEIDIDHINKGKGKTRQSAFTINEVKLITLELIKNKNLIPECRKKYEDEFCDYFTMVESYKLIFCICSDRPKSIGIITLFRN